MQRCPDCRTPLREDVEAVTAQIDGADFEAMKDLFHADRRQQAQTCPRRHRQHLLRTEILVLRDRLVVLPRTKDEARGIGADRLDQDLTWRQRKARTRLAAALGWPTEATVDVVSDLPRLIGQARKHLQAELDLLVPAFADLASSDALRARWREHTAHSVTAVALAVDGLIPGVGVLAQHDAKEAASAWQAAVWGALLLDWAWCEAWAPETWRGRCLEDDLRDYIDRPPFFAHTGEHFDKYVRALRQGRRPGTPISDYLVEAITAAAVQRCTPDIRADEAVGEWTAAYIHFNHGWAKIEASGDTSQVERFKAIAVSPARASATTDQTMLLHGLALFLQYAIAEDAELPTYAGGTHRLSAINVVIKAAARIGVSQRELFDQLQLGLPLEELPDMILSMAATGSLLANGYDSRDTLHWLAQPLLNAHCTQTLQDLGRDLLQIAPGPLSSLVVRSWLAECFGLMGEFARVLDITQESYGDLGPIHAELDPFSRPRSTNDEHPDEGMHRYRLHATAICARAQALLRTGQPLKAVELLDSSGLPDQEVDALIPKAVALAECGHLAEAYDLLTRTYTRRQLLHQTLPPALFDALAITSSFLGLPEEACAWHHQAFVTAVQRNSPTVESHRLKYISAALTAQQPINEDILLFDDSSSLPHRVQEGLHEAVLWATHRGFLADRPSLRHRARALFANLPQMLRTAEEHQDGPQCFLTLSVLNALCSTTDQVWNEQTVITEAIRLSHDVLRSPLPEDLALPVIHHLLDNERMEEATLHIDQLSQTLRRRVAFDQFDSISTRYGERFLDRLRGLLDYCMARPDFLPFALALAEAGRDLVGLAFADTSTSTSAPSLVYQNAPHNLPIAVLERICGKDADYFVLTQCTPSGPVARRLPPPPADLYRLARRMNSRLTGWSSRTRDPFDEPQWQAFETWVADQIAACPTNTHVAVVDDAPHRLHWHVALAEAGYSSSYTTGWTDLARSTALPTPITSVSICKTHRDGDTVDVITAFANCAQRIAARARQQGLATTTFYDASCTAEAVLDSVLQTDLAVWLMHGLVDESTAEVSLNVSLPDGQLPLRTSVGQGDSYAQGDRLNWETVAQAHASPRLLLAAVCSSGASHRRGLGDRLGWYAGLRPYGLQAMITGYWDMDAVTGANLMQKITDLLLSGEYTLTQAVLTAGQAARQEGWPRWTAYPYAVEGSGTSQLYHPDVRLEENDDA